MMDVGKFVAGIVAGVIAILAWMDGRFITRLEAEEFAKKAKVEVIQRMVIFQEFNYVTDKIEKEEKKPLSEQNKPKIQMLYKQKAEIKKSLGM